MKWHYNSLLISILFLLGISAPVRAQSVQAEARLDKASIPLGDQTKLHLTVRFPASDTVHFPELADTMGKIQVVSVKTDTTFDKDDISIEILSHDITLTAFDAGTHIIPSFTIKTKTDSVKTEALQLEVLPVKVDTTKAFYDIKQPIAVSYSIFDWLRDHWLWIVIPLAVILLIAGIIYYFRKRPKPQVQEKIQPVVPADKLTLEKLYQLRDRKLWQNGQLKQYHSELSDVVREYLEKRYDIPAMEQTSEEILAAIKHQNIDRKDRDHLRQLLLLADLVKFAREKPLPAENEQSMENAISFVLNTKEMIQLPDNKEQNGNDELA